jgi:phospholipid/cholesterol/gamma-HCH transport system permease protein
MQEQASAGFARFLDRTDTTLERLLSEVGRVGLLALGTIKAVGRVSYKDVLKEVETLGVRSLAVVLLTAVFTGMVLALQTSYGLTRFGAKMYVGYVVSLSLVRELGPVLTALMVGGRVGSGIAAQLGSMTVTEQIDAMRVMGADPISKLVAPKTLAITLAMPLLAFLADIVGILGGAVVATLELKIPAGYYLKTCYDTIVLEDLLSGLIKAGCFGFLIGLFGCFFGLGAKAGAQGVGKAATQAVVVTAVSVLISDYFLTKLIMLF